MVDILLLVAIRYLLSNENKRRDAMKAEGQEQQEYGYLETVDPNGVLVKQRIEKALLDFTDKENMAFRYPL